MYLLIGYAAAPAGAAWYLAAINPDGSSGPYTAASGILPGSNPDDPASRIAPLHLKNDAIHMPLWQERRLPKTAPGMLQSARMFFEKKRQTIQALELTAYAIGQQKSFWVQDENDVLWRDVTATCAGESQYSYIFVDESLSVPEAAVQLYAGEFDEMHGVVQDTIGSFADRDNNGKVAILLYNINDNSTISGYLAGYFWNKDYLDAAVDSHSNEMDLIYIRGNQPSGWDTIESTYGDFYTFNLTTLAHEYAHMVNFSTIAWNTGTGRTADVWIDEMVALAAESMYFKEKLLANPGFTHPDMLPGGYLASRIKYYSQDAGYAIRNGQGLTCWTYSGDTLANYSLSYLMGQYLALHAVHGQKIFKDIIDYMVAHDTLDYQAVGAVASQQISGIASWNDLIKNWAAANLLNKPSGRAGYENAFELKAHGPQTNPARINNSGIVYREVSTFLIPPAADPSLIFYFFDDTGLFLKEKKPLSSRCTAKSLVGAAHPAIAGLYELRDRVLGRTETGIRLAALYYRHTAEVSLLLAQQPALRASVLHLLVDMLPVARTLATDRGPAVPKALLTRCAAVLGDLSDHGNPELQQALSAVREGLASGSIPRKLGIAITDSSRTTMQQRKNHD